MTREQLEAEQAAPPRLVGVEWWVRQDAALYEERWGAFMAEHRNTMTRRAPDGRTE